MAKSFGTVFVWRVRQGSIIGWISSNRPKWSALDGSYVCDSQPSMELSVEFMTDLLGISPPCCPAHMDEYREGKFYKTWVNGEEANE